MSGLTIFTLIHVVISLVAIGSGFVVLFGLIAGKRDDGWTAFFLATTVATSVTGFGFPIHGFTPGIGIGIISLLVLAVAIFARYARRLTGIWRRVYVVTAVIALSLNFFVLIVQSFSESASSQEAGTDAVRTAFCDHAAHGISGLYCTWLARSNQVPGAAGRCGLIGNHDTRIPR